MTTLQTPTPEEQDRTSPDYIISELMAENDRLRRAQGMHEAGFSLTSTILHPLGIPFQFTMRRATIEEAEGAMPLVKAWIDTRLKAGWRFNVPEKLPPTQAEKDAEKTGGPEAAAAVKQAMAASEPENAADYKTDIAVKLEIAQGKETGRVNMLFFTSMTDRYPRYKIQNWKIDSAIGLLKWIMGTGEVFKEVDGEVLVKPTTFTGKVKLYYKLGAEFTRQDGSKDHYKNIEHLRPVQ